jgi:hypothetical protein
MISICVPFYPYYREYDRTEEIFDVLIPPMIKAGVDNFELVLLDGGVVDKWELGRNRDIQEIYSRLRNLWPGELVYILTNQIITPSNHSKPNKFWMSKAVNDVIKASSYENIFIQNVDIEIPKNFVDEYNKNVGGGKVWFPRCYHIKKLMPRVHENGGWRNSCRGLVGILKSDYWSIGGTDQINYIKDRHDSDLYLRCKAKYNCIEEQLDGLFHVDHPGCNEKISEYRGTW